jgi:hypothetical protein
MLEEPSEAMRRRALDLVREGFEVAAGMRHVRLDRLNSGQPPASQYRTQEELERDFLHAAVAVSTFAVNMGLITPEQAAQVIRDFQDAHPEVAPAGIKQAGE